MAEFQTEMSEYGLNKRPTKFLLRNFNFSAICGGIRNR